MLVKNAENREQLEFVSLENMVPQDHLLRKIDDAIDFKKIYEFVEDLYCEDNGRPSVDPVVLFKIVLIQHIYGISSLRRTLEEVSMNLAYRWFIGYPLNEAVPHFSTVSYNFKHRFNHATVEYVFRWVLKAAAEEGYLDTEAIFVDGTHIKASANLKKQAKKAVPKQAKRYAKELFDEVNKDIHRVCKNCAGINGKYTSAGNIYFSVKLDGNRLSLRAKVPCKGTGRSRRSEIRCWAA